MSKTAPLFDSSMQLEDVIRIIERLADKKNIAYHSCFGVYKNRVGAKYYSATFTSTSTTNKSITKIINAPNMRQLFDDTRDFLQTL